MDIQINWQWSELVNTAFLPLCEDESRVIIAYGGRGSSKSDFAAKKVIHNCLFEDYYKCIVVRATYSSLRESCFENIKNIIEDIGLSEMFDFKVQPLEITCKYNQNKIIFRGLDDVKKIKSVKDPSALWLEEDLAALTYDTWITLTTSLRTPKARYIQELYSINPETPEADFRDNWFYKRFFAANSTEKSFTGSTSFEYKKGNKTEIIELAYSVHHSTYKNNKYLPAEYAALLEGEKEHNPHKYSTFVLGEWSNQNAGDSFYHAFKRATNTSAYIIYDENKPIHCSFDFNFQPYMSCSLWQFDNDGRTVCCVDEIATVAPNNNVRGTCKEIIRKYNSHTGGVLIYGDPAGRAGDTKVEYGVNNFTIIMNELSQFNPTLRLQTKAPNVIPRKDFINTILCGGHKDLKIVISDKCKYLITDLIQLREDPDGKKLKQKIKGVEQLGHFSDGMDYFITTAWKNDFEIYNKGSRPVTRIFSTHLRNPKLAY